MLIAHLLLVVTLAAPADPPCGPLFPMPQAQAGLLIKDVALGDVDLDGELDAAVITSAKVTGFPAAQPEVRWFLSGDPVGGLGSPHELMNFFNGTAFAVDLVDFDLDGDAELVIGTDHEVRIARFQSGTFVYLDSQNYFSNTAPRAMVVGDFNADFRLDVAVGGIDTTFGNGVVQQLRGTAGGGIGPGPSTFTIPSLAPRALAAGRLDGDLDADLAVASDAGTFTMLADATGFSVGSPADALTRSIALADLDGDGDLDRVAGTDSQAIPAYNDGAAQFTTGVPAAIAHEVADLAAGDADGDGDLDVFAVGTLVQIGISNQARVSLLATASGSLAVAQMLDFGQQAFPVACDSGDLDGDGRTDLAAAFDAVDPQSDFVQLMHGSVGPVFDAPPSFTTGITATDVAIADVDSDLDLDVLAANATSQVRWLANDGSGAYGAPAIVSVAPGAARFVASLDADGDGDADLVTGGTTSGSTPGVRVTWNQGAGAFAAGPAYPTASAVSGMTSADLDADGRAEVVVTHSPAGLVSVLRGAAVGFIAPATFAAGATPESIAAGDLDADGALDVVVSNRGAGTVSVLLGNGDGTLQAPIAFAAAAQPQGLAIGDFDGDGAGDVGVATAGSAIVLFGFNGSAFAAKSDVKTGASPVDAVARDFDGDGDPELIVANRASGSVSVLRCGSGQAVASIVSFPAGVGTDALALGDVDGDGRTDLVASLPNLVVVLRDDLALAASETYGTAKAGTHGVPAIATTQLPVLGATAALEVTQGLPGAAPLLLLGLAPASLPFDGGMLLVQPFLVAALPPFSPAGVVAVAGTIPADAAFCDVHLFMQAMFVDAGATGFLHTAQTAGLEWTIGG